VLVGKCGGSAEVVGDGRGRRMAGFEGVQEIEVGLEEGDVGV